MNCPKCKQSDAPEVSKGLEQNSKWQTVWIYSLTVWDGKKGARQENKCLKCGHWWEVSLEDKDAS